MPQQQGKLSDLLAEYFGIAGANATPSRRWHKSRLVQGELTYDSAGDHDLTVKDLDWYIRGLQHFAVASGADDRVSWVGWDGDSREPGPWIEAAEAIEAETGHRVLTWDSGNKGYHQAIVFAQTDFASAHGFVKYLDRRLGMLRQAVERAKVQTGKGDFALIKPGGKLLTLPGGIHPITKNRMVLVVRDNGRLRSLNSTEAIAHLRALLAARAPLMELAATPSVTHVLPHQTWQPPPNFIYSYRPCMDELCAVGVREDRRVTRHAMTLAVIGTVKANAAIYEANKQEIVANIVARNQQHLVDQDATKSSVEYAVAEAERLYETVNAQPAPSCFHKMYQDVAYAIARNRAELCNQCRFQERKRRSDEVMGAWSNHLWSLGVFANSRAKRPGLGQTAGVVYQMLVANGPYYQTEATHNGQSVLWVTNAKIRELTGIAGEETVSKALQVLIEHKLVRKVPGTTRREGGRYTLPVLDEVATKELLERLWGKGKVTPQVVGVPSRESEEAA